MASFMQSHYLSLTLFALAMSTSFVIAQPDMFDPPPPSSPSPPSPPQFPHIKKVNATEEFLRVHNQARSALRVGLRALKWSNVLARDTNRLVRYQRDTKGCKFADFNMTKYGMNQLWASGRAVTPSGAVESWVEKKKYYNYANNTCAPHHNCGVYKQVVWKNSVEVGCAQVRCVKEHVTLTICLYSPPGNVIGQKPY